MKHYAGIPIANIWLLMLYASDFNLSQTRQAIQSLSYHSADAALISWFTDLLEQYLQQPNAAYVTQQQAVSYIRGKVDVRQTYQRQSLQQGKVYCQYQQFSVNHPLHQYLLQAVHAVLKRSPARLSTRLRRCQRQLHAMGIQLPAQPITPPKAQLHAPCQQLLVLAKLLQEFAIPSTDLGPEQLQQPQTSHAHWLRRLFEKAMAGFYKKYLPKDWQVLHGVILRWPQEFIHAALPHMQSDIILRHSQGTCILIDTKFTQIFQQGYYKKQDLFKSQHIYQLYTYLRSQEYQGSRFRFSQGILLYPSVGQVIQADVHLQHYPIGFYSVDLTQTHTQIEQQLLGFISAAKHTDYDRISWPDITLDPLA